MYRNIKKIININFLIFILVIISSITFITFLSPNFLTQEKLGLASANNSYSWQNVKIGGGGYITGLVIHPTEKNLIYIRTDIGGAYRLDYQKQKWIPLMEMFGSDDFRLYKIESIAVDPTDPNKIYAATGLSSDQWAPPGKILISNNRGQTWQVVDLSVKLGGNDNYRWGGERLRVDPHNTKVLYLGTRNDGLWKSTDYGQNWQRDKNLPVTGTLREGISFITFDPSPKSQTIYAGVIGEGIFRSTNDGQSWEKLVGGPDASYKPMRGVVANNGRLYVTYFEAGAVYSYYSGEWKNISPSTASQAGYCGLSVDPNNPDVVMVSEYFYGFNAQIFRSTNAGNSWQAINVAKVKPVSWYDIFGQNKGFASAVASLVIDPHQPNRVWLTDWFAVWKTEKINQDPSPWETMVDGIEVVVNFDLKSPPSGVPLFSGLADINGFRHTSLTDYPKIEDWLENPPLQDTSSIDYQASNSNLLIRVGGRRYQSSSPINGGYSLDNGKNWTAFPTLPNSNSQNGRVAVSANSRRIIWAPENEGVYYSDNLGQSWHQSSGSPSSLSSYLWAYHQPLAADKVNGSKFYIYKDGKIYVSINGGTSWQQTTELKSIPDWRIPLLKTAPNREGEVWLSLEDVGLYRSSDSGQSFNKIDSVQKAQLFAFGKNPPGKNNATVFVYGTVNEQKGIFLSEDMGQIWKNISDPQVAIGDTPQVMEGSNQVYGQVFIGTNGRGIYVGNMK